jgi:hypothetical protein
MKNIFLSVALTVTSLFSLSTVSQTKDQPVSLGLPGDNLDLYAVMEIFQKSKTIEDFEKSINAEKDGINNLDLNNDKKVDFIKVVTDKDGDSFSFILQVAVSKTETQDVAVIFVSKDAAIQIVGDEDLYGKNYVIEPKGSGSSSTVNPGYSKGETMNLPTATATNTTTTIIVQSPPIVQYVYSPAYVPYYSPFYFGFYPPYFRPWIPITYGIYWSNHYHYHGGYYGGYHGSVNININNSNHYNNYTNNARHRSTTVNNYNRNGNYTNNGNRANGNLNNNRANNGGSTRSTNTNGTRESTRPNSPSTRPTTPTSRPSSANIPSTRATTPLTSPSTRKPSSLNNNSRPSTAASSFNKSSNRSASGSRSAGGNGRSLGGHR